MPTHKLALLLWVRIHPDALRLEALDGTHEYGNSIAGFGLLPLSTHH
jgi:hypothetical protein